MNLTSRRERTIHGVSKHQSAWIDELDGMRGIAAMCVAVAHYTAANGTAAEQGGVLPILHELNLPNLAVTCFYGLSAFLLTYLAFRSREQLRPGRFLGRRIARIWPLYFAVVIVGLITVRPGGVLEGYYASFQRDNDWVLANMWAPGTFVINWVMAVGIVQTGAAPVPPQIAVLWSISVEEQFYIVFPFLILLLQRFPRSAIFAAGAMLVAGIISRIGFQIASANPWSMYYATTTYLDVFCFGGIAGYCHAKGIFRQAAGKKWLGAFLLASLVLGGWLWHASTGGPYATTIAARVCVVLLYTVLGAATAAFIWWVALRPESWISRVLRCTPLKAIGILSYGIYVWHPLVNAVSRELELQLLPIGDPAWTFARNWLVMGLYLTICVLVSAIGYVLIESPFIALTSAWSSKVRGHARTKTGIVWQLALPGGIGLAAALYVGILLLPSAQLRAPRDLTAKRPHPEFIQLTWRRQEVQPREYAIEMASEGGEFASIGTAQGHREQYDIGGVSPLHEYRFRVTSIAAGSLPASAEVTSMAGVELVLKVPSDLECRRESPTLIRLCWKSFSDPRAQTCVEMATEGDEFSPIGKTSPGICEYAIGDVSPNHTYRFRVRSVQGSRGSSTSNVAISLPLSAATRGDRVAR